MPSNPNATFEIVFSEQMDLIIKCAQGSNKHEANRKAKATLSKAVYSLVKPKFEKTKSLVKFAENCAVINIGETRRTLRANPYLLGFKMLERQFSENESRRFINELTDSQQRFLERHFVMIPQTRLNYSKALLLFHACEATPKEVFSILKKPNATKLFNYSKGDEALNQLPQCLLDNVKNLQTNRYKTSNDQQETEVNIRIKALLRVSKFAADNCFR